jgi:energy-coupling factor transporter transmembrane protein EcfT
MKTMQTMFKRFLVTLLTVTTLATGILATIIVVVAPLHLWWVWVPAGAISFFVLQPVITNWRETYNNMLGVDDIFEDKK